MFSSSAAASAEALIRFRSDMKSRVLKIYLELRKSGKNIVEIGFLIS
jgi:hypothetical protein